MREDVHDLVVRRRRRLIATRATKQSVSATPNVPPHYPPRQVPLHTQHFRRTLLPRRCCLRQCIWVGRRSRELAGQLPIPAGEPRVFGRFALRAVVMEERTVRPRVCARAQPRRGSVTTSAVANKTVAITTASVTVIQHPRTPPSSRSLRSWR